MTTPDGRIAHRAGAAVAATLTILGALAATYRLLARRWCLTWGATEEEVRRPMAGDELLPRPDLLATRAITIETDADAIWPWLLQFGPGRGGIYSYDRIDRLLGIDVHSAETILPRYQDLAVGDTVTINSDSTPARVAVLDPGRALVFRTEDGNWVWSFGLFPCPGGTRLVSRNRIATPHASALLRLFDIFVMEPGSLVMERKMLRGIKERAERRGDRRVAVPG
ncbi:SRPBCC family protein [Nocardia spumae]|uniref:SRPBCC family protein n=1 Tax=Nocardia spumae TaxID=2887190 RepID=UPI001D14A967|nr:SRPBCC family protein [Nocardia spumae]